MDGEPEKRLIAAVLEMALSDAKNVVKNDTYEGLRAAHFLMSSNSDLYFGLLDIDAKQYRKHLWEFANSRITTELVNDSSARRMLRNNLEKAMRIYGIKID